MNIGLDMMGGDFAPQEAVRGAMQYLQEENTEATLYLIGNNNQIETLLIPYSTWYY